MIRKLQTELAEEADDHAKSEHTLQQLEAKFENLQLELVKKKKDIAGVVQENKPLVARCRTSHQRP